MSKKIKTPRQQQGESGKIKNRVPWLFGLEIKDLVHPITVRPIRLVYAGLFTLSVAIAGYVVWKTMFAPPSGRELVNEMVEAAGGMEAWNNLQQGQFTRIHNLYSENGETLQSNTETFYFKNTSEGLKLQVKSITGAGEEVWIGKDAGGYWASRDKKVVDPVLTARGLGMMCDSKYCKPLCASSMAFYRFSMPFKLTDQGVIPNLSRTDFAVLDYDPTEFLSVNPLVLDVSFEPEVGRDRWRFFVDPDRKLIHKIEYYNKSDFGEIRPEEIYWSDHRTVSGITFSHRWTRYWSNGKVKDEYIFTDVDFNKEIDSAFFERPEEHGNLLGAHD